MARFINGRLKRKEGIWRVDGIGAIRPSSVLGSRLTYHFSQISPEHLNNPYATAASTGATYPLKGHSSWLKLFTPGSLWEKGEKICSPQLNSQHFVIDTTRCIYTFPDDISSFAPYETLLPPSHINFGHNHDHLARTKFAFVPVKNVTTPTTKWLIIPTAELFRFYVGASTRLISCALTASTDKLIDINRTTLDDQVLEIFDLTGTLTHREACFFGRSKTCDAAMETYFGPHKYLATTRLLGNGNPLFINSRFPFNGMTTLNVTGKRIPLTNTNLNTTEWAVLVTQIRRCSHPIGFNHVEINSMWLPNNGTGNSGHGGSGGGPPRPPKIDLEDDLYINDDRSDPSRGTAIARNPILSSDPINRITQNRNLLPKDEFEGLRARAVNTPPSGHTFENGAGGAYGSGNQRIEIFDTPIKDVSRDIKHFIEMLQVLRKKTKDKLWEITTLGSDPSVDKKVGNDVITSFPKMSKRFRWYLISESNNDNAERRRHAVWVKIKIQNRYLYLVEMELKGSESGRSVLGITANTTNDAPIEFTETHFKDLLILTAIHNGWPPKGINWKDASHQDTADKLFEEFEFARIAHLYSIPLKKKEEKNTENQQEDEKMQSNEKVENGKIKNKAGKGIVSAEDWANDIYEKLLELIQ